MYDVEEIYLSDIKEGMDDGEERRNIETCQSKISMCPVPPVTLVVGHR